LRSVVDDGRGQSFRRILDDKPELRNESRLQAREIPDAAKFIIVVRAVQTIAHASPLKRRRAGANRPRTISARHGLV